MVLHFFFYSWFLFLENIKKHYPQIYICMFS